MSSNRLRLDPTKTQFIWFGTRQQLAKIDLGSLPLNTRTSPSRPLSVTLDQELTFVRHINLLCRSCYYQLRQFMVVSRSLSPAAASTLVHAFVVSRLDYCSAIYAGLPTCRLKCLDRVLRTAARLVGRIPRFGRVSGHMHKLERLVGRLKRQGFLTKEDMDISQLASKADQKLFQAIRNNPHHETL